MEILELNLDELETLASAVEAMTAELDHPYKALDGMTPEEVQQDRAHERARLELSRSLARRFRAAVTDMKRAVVVHVPVAEPGDHEA